MFCMMIIWLLALSVQGQDEYIPIVTPKNVWVAKIEAYVGPIFITRYTFSEDSLLIAGKYYRRLLYSHEMNGHWRPSHRFFREDSARVYKLLDSTNFIEKLLYDFNFEIGDTLEQHGDGWNIDHRRVAGVGSIQLMDGIVRKVIEIECTIEGIVQPPG